MPTSLSFISEGIVLEFNKEELLSEGSWKV